LHICLDGKVFFCAINFPGSWADGLLTAWFVRHLEEKIGSYKILTKRAARRLHHDVRDYILKISIVNTSLCQASECGMREHQGDWFPSYVAGAVCNIWDFFRYIPTRS
jgi:hypothetical protein